MNIKSLGFIRSLVRTKIREPIAEPGSNGFLDTELNGIISLGQWDVIKRLLRIDQEWFTDSDTIDLTAGIQDYPLPSGVYEVVGIRWKKEMSKMPLREIGLLDNDNWKATFEDAYFYQQGSNIHIEPAPTEAMIGEHPQLNVRFVESPSVLDEDADETILSEDYVDLLVQYAVKVCAAKKPQMDTLKEEAKYDKMFLILLKQYRENIDAKTVGVG